MIKNPTPLIKNDERMFIGFTPDEWKALITDNADKIVEMIYDDARNILTVRFDKYKETTVIKMALELRKEAVR